MYDISGEASGEIWHWSLLRVKGNNPRAVASSLPSPDHSVNLFESFDALIRICNFLSNNDIAALREKEKRDAEKGTRFVNGNLSWEADW